MPQNSFYDSPHNSYCSIELKTTNLQLVQIISLTMGLSTVNRIHQPSMQHFKPKNSQEGIRTEWNLTHRLIYCMSDYKRGCKEVTSLVVLFFFINEIHDLDLKEASVYHFQKGHKYQSQRSSWMLCFLPKEWLLKQSKQLVLVSLTGRVTEFQFSLVCFSCWRPNRGLSIP